MCAAASVCGCDSASHKHFLELETALLPGGETIMVRGGNSLNCLLKGFNEFIRLRDWLPIVSANLLFFLAVRRRGNK